MKNYKVFISVLLAVVLISSLIACSQNSQNPQEQTTDGNSVTQAVTDDSGEIVTDENGDLVTEKVEAELVTDENGNAVTEVVTDAKGEPVTIEENGDYVNVTQNASQSSTTDGKSGTAKKGEKSTTAKSKKKKAEKKTTEKVIKKPKAPSIPSKITFSDVEENKVKISWSSVKCSGYQVQYSYGDVAFANLTDSTQNTSMTVDGLVSYTEYTFRVRAFNKNSAGTSVSKWVTKSVKTKAADDKRSISLKISLPVNANREDTLIIKIDDDEPEKMQVNLDGSSVTFTSKKKYKGLVKISLKLKDEKSSVEFKTDKDYYEVEIPHAGIYVLEGGED